MKSFSTALHIFGLYVEYMGNIWGCCWRHINGIYIELACMPILWSYMWHILGIYSTYNWHTSGIYFWLCLFGTGKANYSYKWWQTILICYSGVLNLFWTFSWFVYENGGNKMAAKKQYLLSNLLRKLLIGWI